jgi:excisionase family DNA binding protein
MKHSETKKADREAFFENSKMALTYQEMAEAIGVSETALRVMVHRRQIPFVKIGARVRFIRKDIEAWLKKGATYVS